MTATLITRDRVPEVMKAIRDLTSKIVLVGVPAENADRALEDGEEGITNALIGYKNEFGDPEHNIPPRPHLIPAVTEAAPKMVERLKKAGRDALSGDKAAGDKGLHAVGMIGQNAVRAKITQGPFVPLSPVTLAKRRGKGRSGEKPLINTSQYRNAHTYVVKKRGK